MTVSVFISEYRRAIETHMQQDDWFVWVSMNKGAVTMPVFQSLEAFWPGVLVSRPQNAFFLFSFIFFFFTRARDDRLSIEQLD